MKRIEALARTKLNEMKITKQQMEMDIDFYNANNEEEKAYKLGFELTYIVDDLEVLEWKLEEMEA